MDEKVLDAENWKLEAKAVIDDIQKHVKSMEVSDATDQLVYMNLTTIEDRNYCIELSSNGFRVVGNSYNERSLDSDQYFETPYSLLNKISNQFCYSFGNELVQKLEKIKDNMDNTN